MTTQTRRATTPHPYLVPHVGSPASVRNYLSASIEAGREYLSGPKLTANARAQTKTNDPSSHLTLPRTELPQRNGSRRRAAAACLRCRARRLRCNKMEGAPCARCRWDNTECILKKGTQLKNVVSPDSKLTEHVKAESEPAIVTQTGIEKDIGIGWRMTAPFPNTPSTGNLPAFIQPLSPRIAGEDITYLYDKGALTLPPLPLRNALLHAYTNYVHPYMPLLDMHNFITVINACDQNFGQTSLLLFQAVMFTAAAFVEVDHLYNAGYSDRKSARQALFQKAKLLYEFDSESDRLVVVQSLLLMTYWQKGPDDSKDMWHWAGIAISVAQTIGLHRDPSALGEYPRQQKLRRRIWWCCVMRDHLIALGMRQPSRIQAEECEVPMLQQSDFDIELLPNDVTILPAEGVCLRDIAVQQELAALCIAKAKLCICIGSMLAVQYPPLVRHKEMGQNTVESTMKLCPKTGLDNSESVMMLDTQLSTWAESLSSDCQYQPLTTLDATNGREPIALHRTLLHMLYYTTISALHRPNLLLPETHTSTAQGQMRELSQLRVRMAALNVTKMATELHELRLDKYLPTTGVTVMLFAMVVNVQDMKGLADDLRDNGKRCFYECMRVLEKLRYIYDAADWATVLLDTAMRTLGVHSNPLPVSIQQGVTASKSLNTSPAGSSDSTEDNIFAVLPHSDNEPLWLIDPAAQDLTGSETGSMGYSAGWTISDPCADGQQLCSQGLERPQDLEDIDWSAVLEDMVDTSQDIELLDAFNKMG